MQRLVLVLQLFALELQSCDLGLNLVDPRVLLSSQICIYNWSNKLIHLLQVHLTFHLNRANHWHESNQSINDSTIQPFGHSAINQRSFDRG